MSADFLTDFLASILAEQGVKNPVHIAGKAADDLRKSRIVDQKRVNTVELHKSVYALRCKGYTAVEVAERYGLTRDGVNKIVKEQILIKRSMNNE